MFQNDNLLFKKENSENYINGISATTSSNKAYMSIDNDRGYSRIYEPVATAAIMLAVNGYDILNTSLSASELTAEENRRVTVASTEEYILAEYIDIKQQIHLCCFSISQQKFLFGGISSDGKNWKKYSVIKKDTKFGLAAWLCLIDYLVYKGEKGVTQFWKRKSALINEYCEIAAGRANQINDTSLIASLFILCDSVYHTVGTAKVPVYIASTGYLPDVPQDLSAYTPEASQIVVGNEFKVFSNDFIPFVQEEITAKNLFCKFKIADYDSALIPKMPDTYKVPNWVSNLAEYTEFYYSSDLSPELKPKNYLIFGGAGSGKTQGAMALASALGLPFYYINCSSNTDEAAFKGEIMPKLDNVNKTGRIEDFTSFKEEVEMSPEFAYKAITGIERSEVSEEECYAAYINLKAAEQAKNSNGISYYFQESPFIKGVRDGGVVVVEEFTNVRDSGVGIALNELMDGHMSFSLPTGEVIKRNENTIIVFCANVEEANCNEFEASMKSRFHQRIKVETPAKEELIERVSAMTMFNDNVVLEKMATVVLALAQAIVSKGINGTCGVREFANWVLAYSFELRLYGSKYDINKLLKRTAESTVLTGCSLHNEEIEELRNEVILNLLG